MQLPFWKRNRSIEGIVGLGIDREGVALAHVIATEQGPPRLALAEYRRVDDPRQLGATIARTVRERGLEGATCVAVLPPEQYSLRLLDAPEVEPGELASAVRWLVKDLLDFSLEEAVTDFIEIPDQQTRGRLHRIYVAVARADMVRSVVDVARESRLELCAIDISELALRNLTGLLSEDDHGLALLRLGRHRGSLTVTQSKNLYLARTLEAGFDQLSGRAHAFESEADLRFEGEPETFDSLLLEIHRSLDFYESHLGQPPVAHVVLAPPAQEIPELLPFLEKNLVADVAALDVNDVLDCSERLPTDLQAQILIAIGGALRSESIAP